MSFYGRKHGLSNFLMSVGFISIRLLNSWQLFSSKPPVEWGSLAGWVLCDHGDTVVCVSHHLCWILLVRSKSWVWDTARWESDLLAHVQSPAPKPSRAKPNQPNKTPQNLRKEGAKHRSFLYSRTRKHTKVWMTGDRNYEDHPIISATAASSELTFIFQVIVEFLDCHLGIILQFLTDNYDYYLLSFIVCLLRVWHSDFISYSRKPADYLQLTDEELEVHGGHQSKFTQQVTEGAWTGVQCYELKIQYAFKDCHVPVRFHEWVCV